MDKKEIIDKVKAGNPSKEQILGWLNTLPAAYNNSRKPSEYKVGDCLMHPIFLHPYVLLSYKKEGVWVCGLLTSESTCPEILEPCKSRFFSEDNYFTKTLFTASEIQGSFINVYENKKHLREVLIKLKLLFK